MKKLLLSFCLGTIAISALGAVTLTKEGVIRSKNARQEIKTIMNGPSAIRKKARAAENSDIIVTPPAGEKKMMLGSSTSYYIFYDAIEQDESYGVAYECIFCDDGSVYLKNPVSMLDWNTYIKGQTTNDGIEFTFPQPLYCAENETIDGEPIIFMADVLEYTEIEDPNNPGVVNMTFIPSTDNHTIKFVKEDDGSYMMEGENMLGITWNNLWQGYGETQLRLEPFNATPVVAPEGLKYDYSYILADELNGWGETVLRPIGIAYDGDDAYITNMASGMPGAVFKGTFDHEKNTLTIPSNQFMGEFFNHYIFMMTGTGYSYYDEFWDEEMISFDISDEPMVLNFDPEQNVFTPVIPEGMEYAYFIFNFGYATTFPCEYYTVDRIYSQGELTDCNPIAPVILGLNDISYMDPNYSYSFEFEIYGDNAEGQILRDDCIFYNLFINGELFTLTADDYPELKDAGYESLTDIPVFLNVGNDIFTSGNYHGVALPAREIETVGVRALYIDGDIRGESEIVTVDKDGNPVLGVENISDDSSVARTEYFDLFGRHIDRTAKGTVVIERKVFSNGSTQVKKVIR
ncbi:MAG: hypothetical protein HDR84_01405 [Bacteroides sp.]|nr:hypothetical protein [Bacteroides sp.]